MRKIFTADAASVEGVHADALRWSVRAGRRIRIDRNVYADGAEPLTILEESVAGAIVTGGVVHGAAAGTIYGLDSMRLDSAQFTVPTAASNSRGARRRDLPPESITVVEGIRVTSGLQTVLDLAAAMDDLGWEQALESALHKELVTIAAIEAALPAMSQTRTPGVARIRRVLALRPPGAPPTESLLETLMVQLARAVDAPVPTRQLVVNDEHGQFVARVDLCWPELGVFVELDGQHHPGQPEYDAVRQTDVSAATGWLPGRFCWNEVYRNPVPTGRRLLKLLEQGRRRPLRDFAAPERA